MDLKTAQHIFFIGIGGAGMSSLAGLLHEQGKKVSGTDKSQSPNTHMLEGQGIEVSSSGPPATTQLAIYSSAVPETDTFRVEASKRNIPQLAYHEALGQLTKEYETIAICGTHGKTTVTAMLAIILKDLVNPTVIVGAAINELDHKNYRNGGRAPDGKKYLIIEACEYQNHFLNYSPKTILITNIEYDHPDFFKTPDDYRQAFANFIKKLPQGGSVIDSYQNPDLEKQLHLSIPGDHNKQNALAAIAAAQKIYPQLDTKKAIEQLNHFTGAARRFQQVATIGNTPIIDDYAHHPTAIKATLRSARERFGKDAKILCIFQPHQYSRTKKLLPEFATAFSDADEVIIPNIFRSRDTDADVQEISPEKLVEEISKHHPKVSYGHGLEETCIQVKNRVNDFDVIMTMGAGDITNLGVKLSS